MKFIHGCSIPKETLLLEQLRARLMLAKRTPRRHRLPRRRNGFGNVLTTSVRDYNNGFSRFYTNAYLTGTAYAALHIHDRLVTSTQTSNGALVLVSNQY